MFSESCHAQNSLANKSRLIPSAEHCGIKHTWARGGTRFIAGILSYGFSTGNGFSNFPVVALWSQAGQIMNAYCFCFRLCGSVGISPLLGKPYTIQCSIFIRDPEGQNIFSLYLGFSMYIQMCQKGISLYLTVSTSCICRLSFFALFKRPTFLDSSIQFTDNPLWSSLCVSKTETGIMIDRAKQQKKSLVKLQDADDIKSQQW